MRPSTRSASIHPCTVLRRRAACHPQRAPGHARRPPAPPPLALENNGTVAGGPSAPPPPSPPPLGHRHGRPRRPRRHVPRPPAEAHVHPRREAHRGRILCIERVGRAHEDVPAEEHGEDDFRLEHRNPRAETHPRPRAKGDVRQRVAARRLGGGKALGAERVGLGPQPLQPPERVGGHEDGGAGRHGVAAHHIVRRRHAADEGGGGVQAERLVEHVAQVLEAVHIRGRDGVPVAELRAELVEDFGSDALVARHEEERRAERRRGRLVAGKDHVVDVPPQVIVGKRRGRAVRVPRGEEEAEQVRTGGGQRRRAAAGRRRRRRRRRRVMAGRGGGRVHRAAPLPHRRQRRLRLFRRHARAARADEGQLNVAELVHILLNRRPRGRAHDPPQGHRRLDEVEHPREHPRQARLNLVAARVHRPKLHPKRKRANRVEREQPHVRVHIDDGVEFARPRPQLVEQVGRVVADRVAKGLEEGGGAEGARRGAPVDGPVFALGEDEAAEGARVQQPLKANRHPPAEVVARVGRQDVLQHLGVGDEQQRVVEDAEFDKRAVAPRVAEHHVVEAGKGHVEGVADAGQRSWAGRVGQGSRILVRHVRGGGGAPRRGPPLGRFTEGGGGEG
ncbi:hypothetical protein BU14_0031s0138 [Porphyra umbilicalis]|uniref:Uncharacterized protein n=1 Tax=Porphyra umbilicalis TaxID=2786 RepID=A0A1X6PJA5_PORUM|nr:hypothetical protein BU14_0031s0138 [Porphyra umbilicalis]|eukprot:OSX80969.1 hypothetical protein BU14_0031s0138 [Porphyra umbilicalis]